MNEELKQLLQRYLDKGDYFEATSAILRMRNMPERYWSGVSRASQMRTVGKQSGTMLQALTRSRKK